MSTEIRCACGSLDPELATILGKGWFTIFRLYGPKQAFFDRSWKLNDIEEVK